MKLQFSKYQGTGNDFILIDNRKSEWSSLTRAQIAKLCDRRFGIGADGLILLNHHRDADFEMKNYNSDGGECSMCGNGARSLVQFAHHLGIRDRGIAVKKPYQFAAIDGAHEAYFQDDKIHLKMQDVKEVRETPVGFFLNTGSPHLVTHRLNLMTYNVVEEGRKLRTSPMFMPGGVNVNFVESYGDKIFVRTYERGVEDETLSCGTGNIASALTAFPHPMGKHRVEVETRGGKLFVEFKKVSDEHYEEIWLIGPALKTFDGFVEI